MIGKGALLVVATLLAWTSVAHGQYPPGAQGSSNVHIQFHHPSPASTDIRVDQELSRPYVYQAHGRPAGFHIANIKDPNRSSILYSWQIETPELVQGGATGVMLFK